ncbi:MAG: Vitamin B12 import ATP-binding protein BtuD [Myxococcota bacterium]|nr:Vitamin B12 import ATP-binding protein BtuD [Myxococcota bacterium]
MSSEAAQPVIRFEGVSKAFAKPGARELIARLLHGHQANVTGAYALQDISFSVHKGETFGVIGVNGAGKSSLLKLVARVTVPTTGRIDVRGRVTPLIELGAGFHPEFSGYDNIFLNAAVLGMKRAETAKAVDDIIEFSGLGERIHEPVKHYSSGMYVRLGFSIAVFTRPEILLIDEVLAVGDISFQAKCLSRLKELKDQGVTFLFVSHFMNQVVTLCNRVMLLDRGRIVEIGDTQTVVDKYYEAIANRSEKEFKTTLWREHGGEGGKPPVVLTAARFSGPGGGDPDELPAGSPCRIEVDYECDPNVPPPVLHIHLHHLDGTTMISQANSFDGVTIPTAAGRGTVVLEIDILPLAPGFYDFFATVYDSQGVAPYDRQARFKRLHITSDRPHMGMLSLPHRWIMKT